MKLFLASSIVLILVLCSLSLLPKEAYATPVFYNQTMINLFPTNFTRSSVTTINEVMTESGYNGTVNAVYQGNTANSSLNWRIGYHPTLPLSLSTSGSIYTTNSTQATQSLSLTLSTNSLQILVIGVSFEHTGDTNHNNGRITNVAIGSQNFVLQGNVTATCGSNVCDNELWYMINPPSGSQTITITPNSSNGYFMVAGGYDFNNARSVNPIGVTNSGQNTNTSPSLSLTPTYQASSIILDNLMSTSFPNSTSTSSNTQSWDTGASTVDKVYGWWPFNNTVSDVSSNGNTCAVTGTQSYTPGISGKAFNFNGATYCQPNGNGYYDTAGGTALSVSYWIKASLPAGTTAIMDKNAPQFVGGAGWGLWANNGDEYFDIGQTANTNELIEYHANNEMDGTWHHVVWTYDGTKTPAGTKLYIDSVSQALSNSVNNFVGSSTTTNPLRIGESSAAGSPLTGAIGNLMIIKGKVLSQTDVNNLYNSGNAYVYRILGGSQYNLTPTINSPNTLSWTTSNSKWIQQAIEIAPVQNQNNFAFNFGNSMESKLTKIIANASKVYYASATNPIQINHIDTTTGIEKHDYSVNCNDNNLPYGISIFVTQLYLNSYCGNGGNGITYKVNTVGGNSSQISEPSTPIAFSDMKIRIFDTGDFYNSNSSTLYDSSGVKTNNACELKYRTQNTTNIVDAVGCDISIPNHIPRYLNGLYLQKANDVTQNSTIFYYPGTDRSIYKKVMTLPPSLLRFNTPNVRFIGHWNGVDYLVAETSTTIQYIPLSTVNAAINTNRAFQSYYIIPFGTDPHYYIQNATLKYQPVTFLGPSLNYSTTATGMVTIPSGYILKTTTFLPTVRTIDPRWTNAINVDSPTLSTTASNFPIELTVSNAPIDAALKATDGAMVVNNIESFWTVTQLDTTHSAEFDIPFGQCANIYVADISVAPPIYNYEGNICATGVSQKTIAYTNTLPLTFYSFKYGATSSYTPSTNGLSTTVRSSTAPFTYNVQVKNSTNALAINQTFTINGTIDTRNFNVSGISKSASLYITIPNVGQIYTAYIGAPVSLASVSSFFHQYFNYQGFDLLSFIPLVFASMFTRNTVGIGAALTVVLISTLSFFSVVVISDTASFIMIIVAAIGLIGYRGLYG